MLLVNVRMSHTDKSKAMNRYVINKRHKNEMTEDDVRKWQSTLSSERHNSEHKAVIANLQEWIKILTKKAFLYDSLHIGIAQYPEYYFVLEMASNLQRNNNLR
jgi:hypothetical protein